MDKRDIPQLGGCRRTGGYLPLVDVDQGGNFQLLRDLSFTPHGLEELCQFLSQCQPTCFVYLRGESIWSWRFATGELFDGFSDFVFSGKVVKVPVGLHLG